MTMVRRFMGRQRSPAAAGGHDKRRTISARRGRRRGGAGISVNGLTWRAPFPRRPQHGSPAAFRSTLAGVNLVHIFRVVVFPCDVIRETDLFACADRAGCDEEQAAPENARRAIGVALVIQEARVVAADVRIDDGFFVERVEEGVVVGDVARAVAAVGFLVADAVADVFVDDFAALDVADGERTQAVDGGATDAIGGPASGAKMREAAAARACSGNGSRRSR